MPITLFNAFFQRQEAAQEDIKRSSHRKTIFIPKKQFLIPHHSTMTGCKCVLLTWNLKVKKKMKIQQGWAKIILLFLFISESVECDSS